MMSPALTNLTSKFLRALLEYCGCPFCCPSLVFRRARAKMHEDEKNGSDPIIFARAGVKCFFHHIMKSFVTVACVATNVIRNNVSGRFSIGIDAKLVRRALSLRGRRHLHPHNCQVACAQSLLPHSCQKSLMFGITVHLEEIKTILSLQRGINARATSV
jgi:hypothetical protein